MADPSGADRGLSARRPGRGLPGVLALAAAAAAAAALLAVALAPSAKMARLPAPGAAGAAQAGAASGADGAAEAERRLVNALHEIGSSRLDVALAEIDKVLDAHPNFRLAHLIRGDLLLARARPVTSVGNTNHVPAERIEELRAEARARLARRHLERPRERVPRYLVQLDERQKHALVVDTSKYTLYVFANEGGVPRYVADYYITIGKNGIDKVRVGDKKTPVGVYHVTARLARERLAALYGRLSELYGAGALPIDYPNEWDRRQGRNGYGIWLHGVPFDTYSRPPRASDGCVALANADLEAVAARVEPGVTPVIIADGIEWVGAGALAALRHELSERIEAWRRDWESLDVERYLAHYARDFFSGGQDLAAWSEHKRRVNAAKRWIRVGVSQLSIFLYPGRDDLAVASFEQQYSSSNLEARGRKRQFWIRENGAWKILYEGAERPGAPALPARTG